MAKLSLTQIEVARKNPKAFAKLLKDKSRESNVFRYSKWMVWRNTVFHWHKTQDEAGSIIYLTNAWDRHFKQTAKNILEREKFIFKLQAYIANQSEEGYFFIESRKRISIPINLKLIITGEISIINMNNHSGYSLFFLVKDMFNWEYELRFPLIQNYFSETEYGVPLSDVEVGFYCFDIDEFICKSFSASEIKDAMNEIHQIGNAISTNL